MLWCHKARLYSVALVNDWGSECSRYSWHLSIVWGHFRDKLNVKISLDLPLYGGGRVVLGASMSFWFNLLLIQKCHLHMLWYFAIYNITLLIIWIKTSLRVIGVHNYSCCNINLSCLKWTLFSVHVFSLIQNCYGYKYGWIILAPCISCHGVLSWCSHSIHTSKQCILHNS